MNALTLSMAVDFAGNGIRCNAIAPGFVVGKERAPELDSDLVARFERQHLTRLPRADDVAHSAVYLASAESEAVTGVILPVDGGATAARAGVVG